MVDARVVQFQRPCTCRRDGCALVLLEEVGGKRSEWVCASVVAGHVAEQRQQDTLEPFGNARDMVRRFAASTEPRVLVDRPRGRPSPCHACGLVQGHKRVVCANPDCRTPFREVANP